MPTPLAIPASHVPLLQVLRFQPSDDVRGLYFKGDGHAMPVKVIDQYLHATPFSLSKEKWKCWCICFVPSSSTTLH
ncbi:hypothetical protein PVAP13_3KG479202 [Panicum virgatum]|uniref:Uncharacterized protein n=1 Tax=Panicum virgatum TaxID=38727 RepID=A0A8T0VAE7_PANVG|nr:hypothetical protein PVAP13_3KG479202 [Panicum virgatum]